MSRLARGVFCLQTDRKSMDQRWGAGTDPELAQHDALWLESMFPTKGSDGQQLIGADGALWLRRVGDRWFLCHCSIPDWSRVRSIPCWAVVEIDSAQMSRSPILAAAALDVLIAARDPQNWSSSRFRWEESIWNEGALSVIGALFDAAILGSGSGSPSSGARYTFPEAWLDSGGWIALQLALSARSTTGGGSPTAVIVRQHGWTPPSSAVPLTGLYEFRRDGADSRTERREPVARGVELRSFITGFPECMQLMRSICARLSDRQSAPSGFAEAAAASVPLALIDAELLEPAEWTRWSRELALTTGSSGHLAERIEGLLRRAERGNSGLQSPLLRLVAAWHDLAISESQSDGSPMDAREQLRHWVARLAQCR